ncbi:MAG: hypothetical protein Kow002_14570 [Anaerolineales bacterium]
MAKQAWAELAEICLENGLTGGRILCPPRIIPAPGQYLLAHDPASDSPLPAPIFLTSSAPNGFRIAPPIPATWQPGSRLFLRGPLGRGFSLSASAQRVALAALDGSPHRLLPVLESALAQNAAVTLLSEMVPANLPADVEVQPLIALPDAADWADALYIDVARESLFELWNMLEKREQVWAGKDAQALVRTPVPCGGMAECGLCAVRIRHGWKMACKDGPVFDLRVLKG